MVGAVSILEQRAETVRRSDEQFRREVDMQQRTFWTQRAEQLAREIGWHRGWAASFARAYKDPDGHWVMEVLATDSHGVAHVLRDRADWEHTQRQGVQAEVAA